jgi:hypothetical protein
VKRNTYAAFLPSISAGQKQVWHRFLLAPSVLHLTHGMESSPRSKL